MQIYFVRIIYNVIWDSHPGLGYPRKVESGTTGLLVGLRWLQWLWLSLQQSRALMSQVVSMTWTTTPQRLNTWLNTPAFSQNWRSLLDEKRPSTTKSSCPQPSWDIYKDPWQRVLQTSISIILFPLSFRCGPVFSIFNFCFHFSSVSVSCQSGFAN